eukprot:COSAG05_NODE_104_length_18950_cov_118.655403_3_plen_290_part_00
MAASLHQQLELLSRTESAPGSVSITAEQRRKLRPVVSPPAATAEGHGQTCLRLEWSFDVAEDFSFEEIETELQYGYRRKGSWRPAKTGAAGGTQIGATTCTIHGLEPGTGFVARVRARYKAKGEEKAGNWTSWVRSLPMATLAGDNIGEEDPLRPSSAAKMQELFELLVEVTEDSETTADPETMGALVAAIARHRDLCTEATEFLMDALPTAQELNLSPSRIIDLPTFSPVTHKALVALVSSDIGLLLALLLRSCWTSSLACLSHVAILDGVSACLPACSWHFARRSIS